MNTRSAGQAASLCGRVVRARTAAADNRRIGRLPLLARLAALGQYTRRAARMASAFAAPFAAAHRMANGILRRAALMRFATQPSLAACLAQADIHVLGVAQRATGCPTFGADAANFARWQSDLRPVAFAGSQRRRSSRAATKLSAAAGLHL